MSLKYLPDASRLWLFAANRPMEDNELEQLNNLLTDFVSGWKAHGSDLSAGFDVVHKGIVVVAVDESVAPPSGCSIDKVFRLLKEFGDQHGLDFFNRLNLVKPNCNSMAVFSRADAEAALRDKVLGAYDLVLNPEIATLKDFRSGYLQPFNQNWLGQKLLAPLS